MKTKAILFLGIGQTEKSARYIMHKLNWLEAIPPANYLAYTSDNEILNSAMHNVEQMVTRHNSEVIIMAESQAAPALLALLAIECIYPERIVLIQPLGLNHAALGKTMEQRYKTMIHGSRNFWLHTNQRLSIWGNRATLVEVLMQMLRYPKNVKRAYTFGANQSAKQNLEKLIKNGVEVHIFAARDDSLFPYEELKQELKEVHDVRLHEFKGTHVNRATPNGIQQLELIYKELIQ